MLGCLLGAKASKKMMSYPPSSLTFSRDFLDFKNIKFSVILFFLSNSIE